MIRPKSLAIFQPRALWVDEVINVALSDIKVSVTPTLFLVDQSGSVRDVWVGKLDESKEAEVARLMLVGINSRRDQ